MKTFTRTSFTLAAFAAIFAVNAFAANVHLKPPGSKPSFNDGGLILSITANLAGLGGADIVATLSAQAQPTATCTNPAGQTQPAGQNPVATTVTGSVAIPAGAIKNGNVTVSVTTSAPTTPISGAPDCPNTNWTENITDMSFLSAVLTIQQPAGTQVFSLTCTFSPSTQNGTVSKATYTCS